MKYCQLLVRIFITFSFTLITASSFAQKNSGRLKIDSLIHTIDASKIDSTTIKTYLELSSAYYQFSFDTSKMYSQKAAKVALKRIVQLPKDKRGRILDFLEASYENIAGAEYRNNNFLSAESYYLKCMDLKIKYERSGKPHIYNQLSGCAIAMFDFALALDYAYKSLEWTEKIENPTNPDRNVEIFSYNMISTVYHRLEDWEKSHEYTLKCLELSKKYNNLRLTALMHNNIGSYFYEKKREPKKATENYERALELYRKVNDDRHESMVLYNLARLNEELNPSASLVFLEQATKISHGINDWKGLGAAIWFRAHLEFRNGNLAKAERLAIESLEICQSKKGLNLTLKKVAGLLKEISVKKGDWKSAFEYFQMKIEAIEEIRNLDNQKEAMEVMMKHKVEKARTEEKLITEIHKNESKVKSQKIALLNKDKQLRNVILFGIIGAAIIVSLLVLFWFKSYKRNVELKELNAEKELRLITQRADLLETNLNAKMVEKSEIVPEKLNKNLSKLMKTSLTKRETEVLIELCKGKDNKSIAESLFISPNTVRTHLLKIYDKMDVKSRSQAIKKAENLNRLDT